jgi:hypothetical protein
MLVEAAVVFTLLMEQEVWQELVVQAAAVMVELVLVAYLQQVVLPTLVVEAAATAAGELEQLAVQES